VRRRRAVPDDASRANGQNVSVTWSPPDQRRQPGRTVLPAAAEPAPSHLRLDALTGLFTAAVVVLLGAPVGLLWSAVAPHSHAIVEARGAYLTDAQTEVFIAGDGWFLGLTILAGVLSGVLAWLVGRSAGPFAVVGLAVGGLLAAYVASKVGVRIGQDALETAVRAGRPGTYTSNIALQTKAVLVGWPLGAVAAFAALVASRVDEIH
jgi:hypothetical protein